MGLKKELRRDYGVHVDLFRGTLEEAWRAAEQEAKYVVLYLHCPTHESTPAFVKKVLGCDELAARWAADAVVCGASVMAARGERLARRYGATTFPFLAVFFKRRVILRLMGPLTAPEVLAEFRASADMWEGPRAVEVAAAAERHTRARQRDAEEEHLAEMEERDRRRLRELEAAAAQRAEEQRRQREEAEREAREEERLRAEAAAAAKRAQEAAAQRRERHARLREEALARLAPEPAAPPPGTAASSSSSSSSASPPPVVIQLRTPGGATLQRRFGRDELVDRLEDWALAVCLERALEEESTEVEAPAGSDSAPEPRVELLTGFPSAAIVWERGATRFGDVKALCPRATVLVHLSH